MQDDKGMTMEGGVLGNRLDKGGNVAHLAHFTLSPVPSLPQRGRHFTRGGRENVNKEGPGWMGVLRMMGGN